MISLHGSESKNWWISDLIKNFKTKADKIIKCQSTLMPMATAVWLKIQHTFKQIADFCKLMKLSSGYPDGEVAKG